MLRNTLRHIAWTLLVTFAATAQVRAATYDEAIDGDLSGNPAAPTPFVLEPGSNRLFGAAGQTDYDLLAVTIPAGHVLDSLVLDAFVLDFTFSSFIAVANGPTWPTGLGGSVSPAQLIGWELFDDSQIGLDLLPGIASNIGAFTPPLASGVYSILLQDTSSPFTYAFTFNVTAVPEPAAAGLALVGLFALGRRRFRVA
ncbi:MAG: hypothetical protein KF688_10165 [Pirellulales bacterium]|nr:hypothetical protein [Pirellulales bacterium]MBX3432012.1 hypothetical protein [Pirellulales bacterium]